MHMELAQRIASARRTRSSSRCTLLAALLVVGAVGEAEARRGDRLDVRQGVLMLGGRVAFTVEHINPDAGNSHTGVLLSFAPTFGGFVTDGLLLHGGLSVERGFGDLYPEARTEIGLNVGMQYLFRTRTIVLPYLGFGIGPSFLIRDGSGTGYAFDLSFPAGILIALGPSVAVNVGVETRLSLGLSSPKSTEVQIPIGYLGVVALF